MKMRWLQVIILLALLAGCTSARLYPVCQFAGTVPESEKMEFMQSVRTVFRTIGVQEVNEQGGVLEDMRFVIVNGSPLEHKRLAKMWPELGCVGRYSNSMERAQYASCLQYISTSLKTKRVGAPEDSLLCFTTEACPGRTADSVDAVIYCNGSQSP